MMSASIVTLLIISSVTATAQNGATDAPISGSCLELNQAAMTQAASGHLAEVKALLSTAAVSGDERSQGACPGHVLSNMAGVMFDLGHIAEAEQLAEQSVRILEKFYPPNGWVLLRPPRASPCRSCGSRGRRRSRRCWTWLNRF